MIRASLPQVATHVRRTGQAIVEFALASTLIFFLLAAVIDLGFIFFTMQAIHNAAQEGATYGSYWLDGEHLDFVEIRERARMESGTDGGINVINMLDLNSDGIDDLLQPDVLTDYIEIQIVREPNEFQKAALGDFELDAWLAEAWKNNPPIANWDSPDKGPDWCHNPTIKEPPCYVRVTVKMRYELFFALTPSFADEITLRSSYVRPIKGFAQAGETDVAPNLDPVALENYAPDEDADGDGISNTDECPGFATITDLRQCPDSDGDGLPDFLERNDIDMDGDGIPNHLDPDDDGDGIPSKYECEFDVAGPYDTIATLCQDTDGDGIPDFLDDNNDGDSRPTRLECVYEDALINPRPTWQSCTYANTDAERAVHPACVCPDIDSDGIPDYLDEQDLIPPENNSSAELPPEEEFVPPDTLVRVRLLDPSIGEPHTGAAMPDTLVLGKDDVERTRFQAWAWTASNAPGYDPTNNPDPAPNAAANGVNISYVDFRLVSPTGTNIRIWSDANGPPFCVFGETTAGTCRTWTNFDTLMDGDYTLTARAYDTEGVPSYQETRTITVQRSDLTIAILRNGAEMSNNRNENIVNSRDDTLFQINAADRNLGVDGVQRVDIEIYKVGVGRIVNVTNATRVGDLYCVRTESGACSILTATQFQSFEPGEYYIRARACPVNQTCSSSWTPWIDRFFIVRAPNFTLAMFRANPEYILNKLAGQATGSAPYTVDFAADDQRVYRKDQLMVGGKAYRDGVEPVGQNGSGISRVEFQFRTAMSSGALASNTASLQALGYCPVGGNETECNIYAGTGSVRPLPDIANGDYIIVMRAINSETGGPSEWLTRRIRIVDAPIQINFAFPSENATIYNADQAVFSVTAFDTVIGSQQDTSGSVKHRVGKIEFVIATSETAAGQRLVERQIDVTGRAETRFCMYGNNGSGTEPPTCNGMPDEDFEKLQGDRFWLWVRAQSPEGRWSQWVKRDFAVGKADVDVMITNIKLDEDIYLENDTRAHILAHDPIEAGLDPGTRGAITAETNSLGIADVEVRLSNRDTGDTIRINNQAVWKAELHPTRAFYCAFGVDGDTCRALPEMDLLAREGQNLNNRTLEELRHKLLNGTYRLEARALAANSSQGDSWSPWVRQDFRLGFAPMSIKVRHQDYNPNDFYTDPPANRMLFFLSDQTRLFVWAHDTKLATGSKTDEENSGLGVEDVQFRLEYEDKSRKMQYPLRSFIDTNSPHNGSSGTTFCAFDKSTDSKCKPMTINVNGTDYLIGDEAELIDEKRRSQIAAGISISEVPNGKFSIRVRAKAVDGRWSDWQEAWRFETDPFPINATFVNPAGNDTNAIVATVADTNFRATPNIAGNIISDGMLFRIYDGTMQPGDDAKPCAEVASCIYEQARTINERDANGNYCVYGLNTTTTQCKTMADAVAEGTQTIPFENLQGATTYTIKAWTKSKEGIWSSPPNQATFSKQLAEMTLAFVQPDLDGKIITDIAADSRFEVNVTSAIPVEKVFFEIQRTSVDPALAINLPDTNGTTTYEIAGPTGPYCAFGADSNPSFNCKSGYMVDVEGAAGGLQSGTYRIRVWARNAQGASAPIERTFTVSTETLAINCETDTNQPLPAGWDRADIGAIPNGSVSKVSPAGDMVAICATGAGWQNSGSSDVGLHYVYTNAPADFLEMTAKVQTFENGLPTMTALDPLARASLMVRGNATNLATNFNALATTAGNGLTEYWRVGGQDGRQLNAFHYGCFKDSPTCTADKQAFPLAGGDLWLKIRRVGVDSFTTFYSRDGVKWVVIRGADTWPTVRKINTGESFLVGFGASANKNGDKLKVIFSDVRIVGGYVAPATPLDTPPAVDCSRTDLTSSTWTSANVGTGGKNLFRDGSSYGVMDGTNNWVAICGPVGQNDNNEVNIWETSDSFHYVYRKLPADFKELRARIDVWDKNDRPGNRNYLARYAKAGIFIRSTGANNTPLANAATFGTLITGWDGTRVYVRRTNGAKMEGDASNGYRTGEPKGNTGGNYSPPYIVAANNPLWLRIQRVGPTEYIASYTRDPEGIHDWEPLGNSPEADRRYSVDLGANLQIGFGVTGIAAAPPRILFTNIEMTCDSGPCTFAP